MRVLREVAAHGTIAAAATALDFTPSAVSAALERETGVALVDRGPSSVVLTHDELHAIAELRSGRLRLGCSPASRT
jgi:DNA-binding transcriptional LysR family regulator